MQFECHYRTYNSFGPNATLHLAAKWLEAHLGGSYGARIHTIMTEACCRSFSPPRATLETMHQDFEEWRRTLPFAEFADKGTTLRLCYAAVYPTREEVKRDRDVLSVKTFQQALKKMAQLVDEAPKLLGGPFDLDCSTLSADIRELTERSPAALPELAKLYLEYSSAAG